MREHSNDSLPSAHRHANGESRVADEVAALRRENEVLRAQLQTMIENEPECVKLVDRDGRLVAMNPAGLAMLEARSLAEAQARPLIDFIAPEYREAFNELHRRVLNGNSGTLQFAVSGLRGGRRWLEAHAAPQRDGSGRTVGVLAVTRDLTARHQIESARRQAVAALQVTQEELETATRRFAWLAENIREVFWIAGLDGTLVYMSRAFAAIAGRPIETIDRTPAKWLAFVHEEDRERVGRALQVPPGEHCEEYRIVRPDGSVRWVRERCFPVCEHDGIGQVAGIIEDVTEGKLLEAQFLHAQRREAIGTLTAGVAHDLNNILAPILMGASLLRTSTVTDSDRELADMIEQSAQRGAEVVRNLLGLSRGLEMLRRRVKIAPLVDEMVTLVRATFPRDIRVKTGLGEPLWDVDADPTQLHQVMLNLCINARDAMGDRGTLEIAAMNEEVRADDSDLTAELKPGKYVSIAVSDTGSGIAPEIISRIFDPFFTTKSAGNNSGLGLSTVSGIVRDHRGAIRVASETGRGTTFRVYLPASQESVEEDASGSPAAAHGAGQLILVVDDEETVRSLLVEILVRAGYRAVGAADGPEAIRILSERRAEIQLVLSDLQMPEMDGLALMRAIRRIDHGIPILAMGGGIDEATAKELSDMGATDVLRKPFTRREVLDALSARLAADEPRGSS